MKTFLLPFVTLTLIAAPVLQDVRGKITTGDLPGAAAYAEDFRKVNGENAEYAEALSWLARGALSFKEYKSADQYATQTRSIVDTLLKKEKLDSSAMLRTALGASIEVRSRVLLAVNGKKKQAISELRTELGRWDALPIKSRIQKNLNLLTMEGQPAPAIEGLTKLKGKPILVFLWAHWCGDCKSQAVALARVTAKYKDRGLAVIAPTRLYGSTEMKSENATVEEENAEIARVWKELYKGLADVPVVVSEPVMVRYGVSTTPTFALIDRKGIVRLYHPVSSRPLG